MQELLSLSTKSTAEKDMIQKLADASLVTTEGDLTLGDAFVEVAHEALIRNWPQLHKWIDADRAGLRTRTRLSESARDWKNSDLDSTYLYSGARLAVAEEWAASHPGELSIDEAEFLRCSREAQKQREATELEAARKLAEALRERAEEAEKREQEEQARIAESRRLAADSSSALAKYPQRSLLFAVEALRVLQPLHEVWVATAEQSLREAFASVGGRPLVISQSPTSAVGISRDNHWLVTGSKDGTARLWDLTAKNPAASPVVLRVDVGDPRAGA
jgi:Novel STAND NTPase 1